MDPLTQQRVRKGFSAKRAKRAKRAKILRQSGIIEGGGPDLILEPNFWKDFLADGGNLRRPKSDVAAVLQHRLTGEHRKSGALAQLEERGGFNLLDALAHDAEGLADLFEGLPAAVVQAEAHLED